MGQARFATVGPLAAASATNIRTASAFTAGVLTLNGTLVSGGIATLDNPRRVLFTFAADESLNSFAVVGTNWAGGAISETVTGTTPGTVATVLDYKTLTSVTAASNGAGNLSIGTNGVAGSNWVQFDHYTMGGVAFQCNVTGTVNYTVQQTLNDPNNTVNPVSPASIVWIACADANVVAATSSQQSNYQFAPVYARILLNSGSGTVAGTFIQNGD